MEAKDPQERTALHIFLENCHKFASKPALHWLDSDCKVTEQYTYEEVEHRTRELAHGLLHLLHQDSSQCSSDVMVRERAVLCYPPGLEFILTFLACLRAGIIAGEQSLSMIISHIAYLLGKLYHV
jgi:acyl-CoA synthetase (AMP-forming)/AMP-acid ligase II